MTDLADTMLLRVELEPGLADYRKRVLATVLGTYPGVVLVEVMEPRPIAPRPAPLLRYDIGTTAP